MNDIELLKKKFDDWRASKTHKHSAIPKDLWKEIVALSQKYSPIEVANACQVPASKIRQKMTKKKTQTSFIKTAIPAKHEVAELSFPGGMTLKIYS